MDRVGGAGMRVPCQRDRAGRIDLKARDVEIIGTERGRLAEIAQVPDLLIAQDAAIDEHIVNRSVPKFTARYAGVVRTDAPNGENVETGSEASKFGDRYKGVRSRAGV